MTADGAALATAGLPEEWEVVMEKSQRRVVCCRSSRAQAPSAAVGGRPRDTRAPQRWNAGAAAAGAAGGAVGGVAPPSSQSGGPRGGPVPGEVHGARAAEAAREGGAAFGGPVPGAAARPRRRSGWWYGGTLVAHCMLPC